MEKTNHYLAMGALNLKKSAENHCLIANKFYLSYVLLASAK